MKVDFSSTITGVILAGGRATRMGGQDKGLLPLCGEPMALHAIRALRPQVDRILVNANRNTEAYRALGYPVVNDGMGEFYGPLAGMLAAMENTDSDYVLTAPCDSPLLPDDYAERMVGAIGQATLAVATDGERLQPVFALISTDLRTDLREYLSTGGRKIDRWYARQHMAAADFSDNVAIFRNINTPEQLAQLQAEIRA